jgi:hypothetical protein
MDSLITAAGRLLASGDLLGALNRVALREDAPALALKGIAMAQLGDFARAKALLKTAARAFSPREAMARARCIVAEAEIALVSRDLNWPPERLAAARVVLESHGDWLNAAHARHLEARRLLLIGRLNEAESLLAGYDPTLFPPSSRATYELLVAGIAIRRVQTSPARSALVRAEKAARAAAIPGLLAEVENASVILKAPAASLIASGDERVLLLEDVEALYASETLVADACQYSIRDANAVLSLTTRPILFILVRALCESWPADVSREVLVARAFRGKNVDESHRARLRVEMGRLRSEIRAFADVKATQRGFVIAPRRAHEVVVLAPPMGEQHGAVLAFLSDGEAWSSSALAIALGVSQRTVLRSLNELSSAGKVRSFGGGPARRWTTAFMLGFPSTLSLPGSLPTD